MGKKRSDTPDTRLPDVVARSRWVRLSMDNPLVRVTFAFLIVVALFLLLAPADVTVEIPAAGSIAHQDFKAEQEFTAVTARKDYDE